MQTQEFHSTTENALYKMYSFMSYRNNGEVLKCTLSVEEPGGLQSMGSQELDTT